MKLFLLAAVIAAGTLACGDDKTELSWTKHSDTGGDVINEIKWISTNDVSWDDTLNSPGDTTASKGIPDDSHYGGGMAAFNGDEYEIVTPEGKYFRLSTGSNNYEIISAAK